MQVNGIDAFQGGRQNVHGIVVTDTYDVNNNGNTGDVMMRPANANLIVLENKNLHISTYLIPN
jgi:hypothetical protein